MRRRTSSRNRRFQPRRDRFHSRHPGIIPTDIVSPTRHYFHIRYYYRLAESTESEIGIFDVRTRDGRFNIWPDVTSPIARRALAYLSDQAYPETTIHDRLASPDVDDTFPGARELWSRISGSDLAQLIVAGPGNFPTYRKRKPLTVRLLNFRTYPATVEGLLDQVIDDLEYLLPRSWQPPQPRKHFSVEELRHIFAIVIILVPLTSAFFKGNDILLIISTVVLAFYLIYMSVQIDEKTFQRKTKRMVLFNHLLIELKDRE